MPRGAETQKKRTKKKKKRRNKALLVKGEKKKEKEKKERRLTGSTTRAQQQPAAAAKGSGDNWLASRWVHTFTFWGLASLLLLPSPPLLYLILKVTAHFFRGPARRNRAGLRVVADSKPTRSILWLSQLYSYSSSTLSCVVVSVFLGSRTI